MPFILRDRVRETTSTSGTGAIFPSGVVTGGYRTFNSQLSNGDTTLCLVRNNAGQWQTFLGTWNSATQSMARTTVYDGSEGAGVTVNFSGEQQEIWINYPAEKYEHPHVQDINIGAPYGVNTGVRLFTVYKDQSLSATSSMVFRVGGIARGTLTGPTEGVYGFILDEDRIGQTDPSDGVSLIFNASTMRAGWSGGRTLAMDQLYVGNPAIPGSSAAGTAGDGAYHVAGASFAYSYTDAGGIVGDERGNLFGRNDAVRVRNGSGYHWNSAFGNETDVGVESGNEVNWKGGIKVVQWSTDATRGVIQDFAYGINNQVNGTAPGWRVGFALGGFEGWWPFTSDSTVMKALDGNIGGGPAKAFAAGIDFRGITVGESSFAAPGFLVDGSGDLGAVVASGVALQTRDGITAHTAVVGSITVLEGGLYSGAITLTLSAPQGSGTTATATVATVSIPYIENINAAGTGYAVGDTITLVGGTRSVTAVGTITKVAAGGGVQGIKMTTPGNYSVLPSSPIATTTSGAGTGLTITPKVSILTITVTGAGSNYLPFLPPTMTSAGASATYRQALVRVNMTASAAALNVGNNYANWLTVTGGATSGSHGAATISTGGGATNSHLDLDTKGANSFVRVRKRYLQSTTSNLNTLADLTAADRVWWLQTSYNYSSAAMASHWNVAGTVGGTITGSGSVNAFAAVGLTSTAVGGTQAFYAQNSIQTGASGGNYGAISGQNFVSSDINLTNSYFITGVSGGTTTTATLGGLYGAQQGNIFGFNFYARAHAGTNNLNEIVGGEVNVTQDENVIAYNKTGLKVVIQSNGAAIEHRAYRSNIAFEVGAGPTYVGMSGWDIAFAVKGVFDGWPINRTWGKVFGLGEITYTTTPSVGFGLDFQGITINQLAWRSNGITMSGTGTVGATLVSGNTLQTLSSVVAKTASVASVTIVKAGLFETIPTLAITGTATLAVATMEAGQAGTWSASPGTGYAVNDILTGFGGTFTTAFQLRVLSVDGSGRPLQLKVETPGNYTVLPANPVTMTGGTGTGLQVTMRWGIRTVAVPGAGSGYPEAPLPVITTSGGGLWADAILLPVMTATQTTLDLNPSGTVNTAGRTVALRVVTAAGAVTVSATDDVVVVNKTVGAATTVNLPAGVTGRRYTIKDGKGDAAANNITITPAAGNIDGAATLVINTNYGRATVAYNGTQWNQVA